MRKFIHILASLIILGNLFIIGLIAFWLIYDYKVPDMKEPIEILNANNEIAAGDVISINYAFVTNQRVTNTVTVTSVVDTNTFTFISPELGKGPTSNQQCTLYYVIKNNYNVNSLTINSVGRYTISINTASGITGTSFIPFIQATTTDNSLVIVQPEAITSPTSLTVRTFNAVGTAITPQWLHIGVTQ